MSRLSAAQWLRMLLLSASCLGWQQATAADGLLQHIADSLALNSPIEHIPPTALADADGIRISPRPLLFDVREAEEYAISHLPGAVRIDPQMDSGDFLDRYGPRLSGGQTVLFYCTTGRRSTALAERIKARLEAQGRRDVRIANLYSGIIGWHNAGLPLADAEGATRRIHPYNWAWKWLLDHPGTAAYRSDQNSSLQPQRGDTQ